MPWKMKNLENKWLPFSFGILAGILISGILFIAFLNKNPDSSIDVTQLRLIIETQPAFHKDNAPDEGKIDINQATLERLIELPGIGPAKAMAIIEFREKYGPYSEINELLYVPGIGEEQLNQILPFIEIP